ncbi:MAG TPA: HAD family hydrolase [Polyangia bacterium]|nr:HAD family hydrolase [Polyangia bacterium]
MTGRHPGGNGLPSPRAVIFDLDGTLVEPILDFDAMRVEIGLRPGLPILEQLAEGDDALRARAEVVMRRHELAAIAQATLSDGCVDLLEHLAARKVPVAILTRNIREVVDSFIRKFALDFVAAYTREDGPPKPSPAGVLHLCQRLGAAPADTLTVGDYKFDIIAGLRAGCRTALVTPTPPEDLAAWGPPHIVVRSLRELVPLFV